MELVYSGKGSLMKKACINSNCIYLTYIRITIRVGGRECECLIWINGYNLFQECS